jgi:hypothetical protein
VLKEHAELFITLMVESFQMKWNEFRAFNCGNIKGNLITYEKNIQVSVALCQSFCVIFDIFAQTFIQSHSCSTVQSLSVIIRHGQSPSQDISERNFSRKSAA